eukprot:jgi/Astpho2/6207/fgenesh1_pg.00088_%23_35_t
MLCLQRLAFPKGASAQTAGLASNVDSNKSAQRALLTDDEPMPETAPAEAADQAAAGSERQSGQAGQQTGASSDVVDLEAHLAQQEDGQAESGGASLGSNMAATSAPAGQPAAAEERQEPLAAAGQPAAAEEPQELMPAAGQPEQQSEPARKRQRRAVRPGRRAAAAAAEPVEDAAALRQLAVLPPPWEHGSTRDSLAVGAIEQEGNDGQWDSTWDVEDLRDAKQNIDRARKTKIQKLRADQEQERRDMETRHKQAVEEVYEEAKQQQADAEEAAVHSLQLKLMACSTEWQACQDAWRQAQGRLAGKLVEQFVEELRITEECFRQQALRELSADWSPEHKSRRRRKT